MSKDRLEKVMALLARARESNERTRQLLAAKGEKVEVEIDNDVSMKTQAFQTLLEETRAKRLAFRRRFPDMFNEDLLTPPVEQTLTAAA